MPLPNQILSIPHLAGFTLAGDDAAMERPDSGDRGFLYWNGTGWVYTNVDAVNYASLIETQDIEGGIAAISQLDNALYKLTPPDNLTYTVKFVAGHLTTVEDPSPPAPITANPSPFSVMVNGVEGITAARTTVSKVTFSAKSLGVVNAAGDFIVLDDVQDISADLTVAGKNGRDGAISNNTWCYYYAIYNPTTREVAGIVSESDIAPTLTGITGFTYWGFAGIARSSAGATEFKNFTQVGRKFFVEEQVMANAFAVTNALTEYTGAILITAIIPPAAKTISGRAGTINLVSGSQPDQNVIEFAPYVTGFGSRLVTGGTTGLINTSLTNPAPPWSGWVGEYSNLPLAAEQKLFCRLHNSHATMGVVNKLGISIHSYTI